MKKPPLKLDAPLKLAFRTDEPAGVVRCYLVPLEWDEKPESALDVVLTISLLALDNDPDERRLFSDIGAAAQNWLYRVLDAQLRAHPELGLKLAGGEFRLPGSTTRAS